MEDNVFEIFEDALSFHENNCGEYDKNEITKIIKNVYLSSIFPICNKTIEKFNISAIINLSKKKYKLLTTNEVKIYNLDINDDIDTKITPYFKNINNILDKYTKTNKNVLIHCKAGINRSGAFLSSYILSKETYANEWEFYQYFLYIILQIRKERGYFLENKNFRRQIVEHFIMNLDTYSTP